METAIRTHPRPSCPLCGSEAGIRYLGLKDRLWQAAPGEWNMRECPRCGCLWIDPVPDPADIRRLYAGYYTHVSTPANSATAWPFRAWDRIADGYLSLRLGYRNRGDARLGRGLGLLAYLHPGAPDEVAHRVMHLHAPSGSQRALDVGCGNGDLMDRLEQRGWEVVGIDLDENAVAAAKSRGLDARTGDLASQQFPDASFDAITLSHVIEHVPDPAALLAECCRILRSDGTLVVLTPNARSWGHAVLGDAWIGLDPPRHLVLFNRDNLRSIALAAGLRIVQLRTGHRAVREQWWLSRRIKQKGRADVMSLRLRWQLRGVPMQYLQRIVLPFRPEIGEELILVATKD